MYKGYTHGGVTDKTWYVLAVYGNENGGSEKYWKEQHLYGSSRLGIWEPGVVLGSEVDTVWGKLGLKRYELVNHLGNVLATVSDKAVSEGGSYVAEVLSAGDYYPFGMGMMDRKYVLGSYRYGFNGKENDNEVKGEGNEQDYGMRVYDGRVGRFLSVDPLMRDYPWYTPYQFAGNTPIQAVDRDGAEEELTQLANALKFKAQLQMDRDWLVKSRNTGTIKVPEPNWAAKWKAWNESKSSTHTWAILSRLAYGILNDGKIAYSTVSDGKNSARGLDNVGVTDYKERVGAGLNTLWLFNPAGSLESKVEGELEEGFSLLVGSETKTKKLYAYNSDGTRWSLSDINNHNRELYSMNVMNNCVYCSIATDSYLKGFAASALYINKGLPTSFLEQVFARKFTWNLSIKDIEKMVSNPGDLGIVVGIRPGGSAHAFNVYK